MKILIFVVLGLSLLEAQSVLGLKLENDKWIGLGFYLAPLAPGSRAKVYDSCFSDKDLFLKLPYEKNRGILLTGLGWKDGVFALRGLNGLNVWCSVNAQGLIPELVFYKDLTEANKLYANRKVWLKRDYFYTWGENFKPRQYKAKKFDVLEVTSVELAYVSAQRSIRVNFSNAKGLPGFFEIGMTAVNRSGPFEGLEEFCHLTHPSDEYQINAKTWMKIKDSKVIGGMSLEEVKLAIGEPLRDDGLWPTQTLLFRYENMLQQLVFYKGKLDQILPYAEDGVQLIGNQ